MIQLTFMYGVYYVQYIVTKCFNCDLNTTAHIHKILPKAYPAPSTVGGLHW